MLQNYTAFDLGSTLGLASTRDFSFAFEVSGLGVESVHRGTIYVDGFPIYFASVCIASPDKEDRAVGLSPLLQTTKDAGAPPPWERADILAGIIDELALTANTGTMSPDTVFLYEDNPFSKGKDAARYNYGFTMLLRQRLFRHSHAFDGVSSSQIKGGVFPARVPGEKAVKGDRKAGAMLEYIQKTWEGGERIRTTHEAHAVAMIRYYDRTLRATRAKEGG